MGATPAESTEVGWCPAAVWCHCNFIKQLASTYGGAMLPRFNSQPGNLLQAINYLRQHIAGFNMLQVIHHF